MFKRVSIAGLLFLLTASAPSLFAQAENVPADHRVYDFLRRMEVQQILPRYHGTVIPLSRRKVGEYVAIAYEERDRLSRTDRDLATLFLIEFGFDVDGELRQIESLFSRTDADRRPSGILSNRQKYLYLWHDDADNLMFIDGIVSYEHRSRWVEGDAAAGTARPSLNLIEVGGRIRGTLGGRFGYYLEGANMMVAGDRSFAAEDNRIIHSHSFRRSGEKYAEFSSAHVRYDAGIVGIMVGRERLLWRESVGPSLFMSDNAPLFNFLRIDLSYKSVSYNYIHGTVLFHNYRVVENNKFYVANRFEFSVFNNVLQMGLNQTTMYSRGVPEIGYLIPFNILEATERNLGDRDASMIGFDIALRPMRRLEVKTGMFFDDIHFDKSFTSAWNNMWSVHAGFFYTEPFGLPDVDIMANYTRIEPHVYSHHRPPFVHYEHDGFLMGHPLGPNSDEILARVQWRPGWQWNISADFTHTRHGDNLYDETGGLIRNVGGDVFVQWDRDRDSPEKRFLDGSVSRLYNYRAAVKYEVIRQLQIAINVQYSSVHADLTDNTVRRFTIGAGIRAGRP